MAMQVLMALVMDSLVMICRAVIFLAYSFMTCLPAALANSCISWLLPGVLELPGIDMPMTSVIMAIVLPVPIMQQAPPPGTDTSTSSSKSA